MLFPGCLLIKHCCLQKSCNFLINFKKNIEMKEILLQKIMQYYEVVFAFDDDEKVIELYKKYNIKILHVI